LSTGAPPQTPLGELTALPQTPYLDFRGPTSKGRGRDERGREAEENIGKGRGGKREGMDGGGEG